MKQNLFNLDREGLKAYFADLGEPSFRADQLMKWIHQRSVMRFDAMTDLSKVLRAHLSESAVCDLPAVASESKSFDGTRKWLFSLHDGNCIETVFIPEPPRGTLCVSSQVGCSLTCSFCATGHHGFNRNLDAAEIIGQVFLARNLLAADTSSDQAITNIVLMGMGEPLMNYDQVVPALNLMLDDCSYGFSKRRVTLSTAGVVPAIDRLRTDCPVSLAVSLHAPNDELRDRLVPLNRKYPIRELLDACRRYVMDNHRARVTFEYIMLAGVNDSLDHARQLVRQLEDVPAKVNLIPYNPVRGLAYRRSSRDVIDRFRTVLLNAGVMTITRKTRGDDVDAACGQLAGKFEDRTRRSIRFNEKLLRQQRTAQTAQAASLAGQG